MNLTIRLQYSHLICGVSPQVLREQSFSNWPRGMGLVNEIHCMCHGSVGLYFIVYKFNTTSINLFTLHPLSCPSSSPAANT